MAHFLVAAELEWFGLAFQDELRRNPISNDLALRVKRHPLPSYNTYTTRMKFNFDSCVDSASQWV